MREYLFQLLETSGGELAAEVILLRLAVSAVIAAFVFLSYRLSHSGSIYSARFNVSLAALTVITTTVMIVIGNNIALSLGMVGALSIVRFRTAIKDSRDTVYIFWAIVVGHLLRLRRLSGGRGGQRRGVSGAAPLRPHPHRQPGPADPAHRPVNESKVESLIFQYYDRKAILRAKNTTEASTEYIYELNGKYLRRPGGELAAGKSITEAVYEIGGIEYFNIVMQNDEISG